VDIGEMKMLQPSGNPQSVEDKVVGRVLTKVAVIQLTGLSKSTIYSYIQLGKFPSPIKLGFRRVGWLESEVLEWINERVRQSRNASQIESKSGAGR
jgi:prophage regulatory protein